MKNKRIERRIIRTLRTTIASVERGDNVPDNKGGIITRADLPELRKMLAQELSYKQYAE